MFDGYGSAQHDGEKSAWSAFAKEQSVGRIAVRFCNACQVPVQCVWEAVEKADAFEQVGGCGASHIP